MQLATRKKKLRRYRAILVAVMLSALAIPSGSSALDLGLTPNHVYSLWTNINASLNACARVVHGDPTDLESFAAMEPKTFSGKKPADVLNLLVTYRAKLDRLLRAQRLPDTTQAPPGDDAITPSHVYLNSGHVLNAQLRWLTVRTGPAQIISQFYTQHEFSGKTPSNVFALVDLAIRRMDRLLQAAGI